MNAGYSKIHPNTIQKRFGGWKKALIQAGIPERYSNRSVTDKMHNQISRKMSDEDIISELKRISKIAPDVDFTREKFLKYSPIGYGVVLNRFKSWSNALRKAGIQILKHGMRYTDTECYQNLLKVWMHYGRAPKYQEMKLAPSTVGSKAYLIRWGSWNKSLEAFIKYANQDKPADNIDLPLSNTNSLPLKEKLKEEDNREIRLGLRYKALKRDGFKCVLCGKSSAINIGVELHIDHIVPVSKGGKTILENLRTTCRECNLGKGQNT